MPVWSTISVLPMGLLELPCSESQDEDALLLTFLLIPSDQAVVLLQLFPREKHRCLINAHIKTYNHFRDLLSPYFHILIYPAILPPELLRNLQQQCPGPPGLQYPLQGDTRQNIG